MSAVTIEKIPSTSDYRPHDYAVMNAGVEVFHTDSKIEAEYVASWIKMQEQA
jgi:hypothetical protein